MTEQNYSEKTIEELINQILNFEKEHLVGERTSENTINRINKQIDAVANRQNIASINKIAQG